jgi:V8-like Glu-specific endopeptidase
MSERLVEHIKELFPDLKEAERRIDAKLRVLDAKLGYQARGVERVIIPTDEYPQDLMRRELLAAGREGLSKVRRGWTLNDQDIEGLEALVDETLPFLVVKDGEFELPENWTWLEPEYERMKAYLHSVGRIGRAGSDSYWGTGFLVSEGIVMTNWHVVMSYVFERDGKWTFYPHIKAQIDFRAEYQTSGEDLHPCTEVIYKHPEYDLVLIRIDVQNNVPPPLPVASTAPHDLHAHTIYVLGYPYVDTRKGANIHAQWQLLSMWKTLGFKHLALGYAHSIIAYQPDPELNYPEMPYLCHLVSTLPGNSGSCVIDAETHQVVGLHCSGDNVAKRNYAVPLWELRDDETLLKTGVSFQ